MKVLMVLALAGLGFVAQANLNSRVAGLTASECGTFSFANKQYFSVVRYTGNSKDILLATAHAKVPRSILIKGIFNKEVVSTADSQKIVALMDRVNFTGVAKDDQLLVEKRAGDTAATFFRQQPYLNETLTGLEAGLYARVLGKLASRIDNWGACN